MDRLEGHIEEEAPGAVAARMADALGIEQSGVLAAEPPGHILTSSQVSFAHPWAITVVIGVVVHVACERAPEGKAPRLGGQALSFR